MSSALIDACHLQIPHTDQVCAWLKQHAGLKTVDLERAQRLSTDASDLLGLLTRLGLVSEIELASA
ncbi:MAG TPA: type II secretion system protein GspE, partial [Pseudomonas sp.]|nr:type II secretion system protein GspE [Pseudomonas sp.]